MSWMPVIGLLTGCGGAPSSMWLLDDDLGEGQHVHDEPARSHGALIAGQVAFSPFETAAGSEEGVFRRAFLAGNDVLLTTAPPDWDRGLDYVGILMELSREDSANTKRINEACRHILMLKDQMGLLDGL